MAPDPKSTLYCSFCGKSQTEVKKLIAGPTVFICNECIALCVDIVRESEFDIMPLRYSPEDQASLLANNVPSVVDIMLLSGFEMDEQNCMTGAQFLERLVFGLHQATLPEGKAKIRKARIADIKSQMQDVARPAREGLAPLREQLRRLLKEDQEAPP